MLSALRIMMSPMKYDALNHPDEKFLNSIYPSDVIKNVHLCLSIPSSEKVSDVQQILGHSSIRTTQIYIHLAAKKQADILKRLHPRNKMKIEAA